MPSSFDHCGARRWAQHGVKAAWEEGFEGARTVRNAAMFWNTPSVVPRYRVPTLGGSCSKADAKRKSIRANSSSNIDHMFSCFIQRATVQCASSYLAYAKRLSVFGNFIDAMVIP
jgi:hypothetical protein